MCCSNEERASRALIVAIILRPVVNTFKETLVGTHERNTKVGSKKRRSKRFKFEECNLVKDAAHCVALLEIDFYALPTGEIFLFDLLRSGWNGLVTFEYNVNGVRCGGFVSN